MLVSELKTGMLLKPKKGFVWRVQNSVYSGQILCLTVEPCESKVCDDDQVAIYVGERSAGDITYGKQMVLWKGNKISVNPSAWRCIVPVKL